LEEQEVVINFGRNDEFVTAYVTDRTWMTKLDKRVSENPQQFSVIEEHIIDGSLIGRTYKFPKKLITIRTKEILGREFSEEHKQALAEGLRKWREEQKQEKNGENELV